MTSVICFDLDGVYFSPIGKERFNTFLETIKPANMDTSTFLDGFHNSNEMRQLVRGQIPLEAFGDFFRSYTGSKLSDAEFANAWVAGYEINQEVRSAVLRARAQGYKTCVCTNNNKIRLDALSIMFPEFVGDFDFIVSSHQVGECKPARAIFEKLIERSGVLAEQILYSDDNKARLSGAHELGIQTFVYHDFPQFVSELQTRGIDLNSENK